VSDLLIAATVSHAEADHEGAGRNTLMAAQDAGTSGTAAVGGCMSKLQSLLSLPRSTHANSEHACMLDMCM